MATTPDYFHKYPTVAFERDDNGIVVMRLHSDGGPVQYSPQHHTDWVGAFYDVGSDPDNRVVILTGTGDEFMAQMPMDAWLGEANPEPITGARSWEKVHREGKRILRNLIDIEVPVIGVVNGPATVHPELVVLSDITLAATTATFQDSPHFPAFTVPGDGTQIVWTELLGSNRGRYFLITGQKLSATEALELGVVNEVLAPDELLPRAYELAREIVTRAPLVSRYVRTVSTIKWKRLFDESLGYGLALEGLGTLDLIDSSKESN